MLLQSSCTYPVARKLKVSAKAQDFHRQAWYAVVRFPVPHTEGQMVTLSLRRCCCNFGQTLYVTKRNKQAANSRYPVVALQHQDGNGGRPQTAMLSWQFLEESVIAWKVAGSCHQLLAIWSFQSIAWLGVFMCITGIAPELGYTVGSLAMLCHRMHEFQLLRN